MADGQVSWSFDSVTLKRIGKGILYAVILPAVIALLDYIGAIKFDNPNVAMLAGFIIPTLVNIIKEWIKGDKPL